MPKSDVIVYIQYLLFYSNCWVLYPQVLVNFWQEKLRENSAPHEHWIYWSWATGCKSALKWVWWEKYGLAYVRAHPNLIMKIHFVWALTPPQIMLSRGSEVRWVAHLELDFNTYYSSLDETGGHIMGSWLTTI